MVFQNHRPLFEEREKEDVERWRWTPLPPPLPQLLVYHCEASRGSVMADCIRDMGLIFHLAFITFTSHQSAGNLEVRAIWHTAGLPPPHPEMKSWIKVPPQTRSARLPIWLLQCSRRLATPHRPSTDCLNPRRENLQLDEDIRRSDPLLGLTEHFSLFYKGLKCPRGRWCLMSAPAPTGWTLRNTCTYTFKRQGLISFTVL